MVNEPVLRDLESGEMGLSCDSHEMIEVPANLIIELSYIFGDREYIRLMESHMHSAQMNWILNVIAQYADELEQKHQKPIANRNRDRSKNKLA